MEDQALHAMCQRVGGNPESIIILLTPSKTFLTAFSAVGASINNLGPGLGEVSENYAGLSGTAKWTLCLAMLLGRLEVFTVLVLLTPAFWRK